MVTPTSAFPTVEALCKQYVDVANRIYTAVSPQVHPHAPQGGLSPVGVPISEFEKKVPTM